MMFVVPNSKFIFIILVRGFMLNAFMHFTLTMSRPPISSPLTYSCGYVGQLENVLSPCLTCGNNQKCTLWLKTQKQTIYLGTFM